MIKEYCSNTMIVLVAALLGSPRIHPAPDETEWQYTENVRKMAVITNDIPALPEPLEIYRRDISPRPTLQLESDDIPARINVQFRSIDGPASSMYPHFKVTNTGDTGMNLAGLALRYWFNCDCTATAAAFEGVVDWAGFMPSGLSITSRLRISFEQASAGRQTHAMVVRFVSDSPSLPPGQSVEIHTRFNRKDWGNMPPMNDWSYAPFDTYTGWNRVAAYLDGNHVWGREP